MYLLIMNISRIIHSVGIEVQSMVLKSFGGIKNFSLLILINKYYICNLSGS